MEPEEIQCFHDSLRAAVVAGVPIEIGGGRRKLDVASLDRWEDQITSHLQGSDSKDAAALDFDSISGIPGRYCAALRVFLQTGSMTPVLDGLTARRFAERKSIRAMRWAFTYLFLLLTVAFIGLSLFTNRVVPLVDDMRADMLLPAAIKAPAHFDATPWMPLATGILGWSLVAMLLGAALGGVRWAVSRLGGHRYVHDCVSATALRIVQWLADSGMPADEAATVSCELADADPVIEAEIKASAEYPEQFGTLADYLAISADRRLEQLRIATPIGLVCTIGGSVALVYCLAIFWPILTMLKDLATAGT